VTEPITREQFEREYAERSGLTVERLRELGRVVLPCECDYEGCQGWRSVSREIAAADRIDYLREYDVYA
jgi:hypothetical protein